MEIKEIEKETDYYEKSRDNWKTEKKSLDPEWMKKVIRRKYNEKNKSYVLWLYNEDGQL